MTVLVSALTASMRFTLLDASKVTFSDVELFSYINEGMAETCLIKPEAYFETLAFDLQDGVYQSFTDNQITGLLEVLYNVGDGSAVTPVDKGLMEVSDPLWKGATPVVNVMHYMYDPQTPRTFLVYPPATGDYSTLMVKVSMRPDAISSLTDLIPITETYYPAVIAYALSRAYMKNSKKQDTAKAGFYFSQWAQAVGLHDKAEKMMGPKVPDGAPA